MAEEKKDKTMVYMDNDVHTKLKKIQVDRELMSISSAMRQVLKEWSKGKNNE